MQNLMIRVEGLVQGVWFRKSTQVKAHKLGLVGFVRNEKDGSVYIEVKGDDDSLDQLIIWCRRGPENARVDRIIIETCKAHPFETFEVRS